MLFEKKYLTAILLVTISSLSANVKANTQNIILNGTISSVTCEISLNSGNSILNVGNFASDKFVTANTQLGKTPLNISLMGCDKASTESQGALYVKGQTASASANNNIFVNDINQNVGFMFTAADGQNVANNTAIPFDVIQGNNSYQLLVGMGATTINPANGFYSAPIVIAYISD